MANSINTVAAANVSITVYAGDTFTAQLTFTDNAGNPIDFTDITLKMQVKKMPIGTISLQFTEGGGITKNVNVVTLSKIISIKGGAYVYDLQATDVDNNVITYLQGTFTVMQDVTDAQTT